MSGQGSKYCDGSLCERKSFPADYAAACHLDPGPGDQSQIPKVIFS